MRFLCFLLLGLPVWAADQVLVACMVTSGNWVVGAKLPPSGLVVRTAAGWQHRGYNHPYVVAVVPDYSSDGSLWLAAGNGAIHASKGVRNWRIATDHTVTELRDIATHPAVPKTVYFGHTAGLAVSRDAGNTWQDATGNRPRRYTESIVIDRANPRRLITAGEDGVWLSEDESRTWRAAGGQGFHILRIAQSPHDPADWLAVTMRGGPLRSRDGGRSFESINHLGVGRYLGSDHNAYDVAFDPTTPGRIAFSIWGTGVALSEDNGKTWSWRNNGLPRLELGALTFDPNRPGRMYVGVHEEALYASDDLGKSWRNAGLENTSIHRLLWFPAEMMQ